MYIQLHAFLIASFLLVSSCTRPRSAITDENATGSVSPNDSTTTEQEEREAPSNLSVSAITTNSMRLAWSAPSEAVESFLVEQSLAETENWQEIASVAANVDNFEVTGLSPGLNYLFRVTAVYPGGQKGVSEHFAVSTIPLYSLTRGYTPRACGIDADGNGTPAEAGECDYCDGVTTDPDLDGIAEDIFYVSSLGDGNDSGACSSGAPCATISEALSRLNGTGEEDIICISGTFNESLVLTQSGKTNTAVMLNNQGTDIEVSTESFSLMGWDRNNNGQYPPFDSEDTAIIDGQNTRYTAFDFGTNNVSNTRIAHLTVRNFSKQGANHSKLFNFQSSSVKARAWVHDVVVEGHDIGGNSSDDSAMVFGLASWAGGFSNLVVQNISVVTSTTLLTGNVMDGTTHGRILIENVSYRLDRGAGASASIFHGRSITNMIVRNSHFDADIANWSGESVRFASIGPCNKNWTLDNNSILDVNRFVFNWLNENCTPSTAIDNMVVTRNHVILATGTSTPAGAAIDLTNPVNSGSVVTDETNTSEDWTFVGNLIVGNPTAADYCFRPLIGNNGSSQDGQVVFSGNTCVNFIRGFARISIPTTTHKQNNYIIQNNLVIQPATQDAFVRIDYDLTPTAVIDYNIFTTDGPFDYFAGGPQVNFADWLTDSPYDDNSSLCTPTYEIGSELVYRLAASDTCARGAGTDLTPYLSLDFEGDAVQALGNVGWDH